MNISFAFQNINWLSVVVATLAAFAIGSIWYSPVLFSKAWMKELKLTRDDLKRANIPLIFGGTFVLQFIAALVLDMFIGLSSTWIQGLVSGVIVGLGWISTTLGINYLYGGKSLKLYLIDAGHYLFVFLVMGIILGAW
jgi:hypothetical protein